MPCNPNNDTDCPWYYGEPFEYHNCLPVGDPLGNDQYYGLDQIDRLVGNTKFFTKYNWDCQYNDLL